MTNPPTKLATVSERAIPLRSMCTKKPASEVVEPGGSRTDDEENSSHCSRGQAKRTWFESHGTPPDGVPSFYRLEAGPPMQREESVNLS